MHDAPLLSNACLLGTPSDDHLVYRNADFEVLASRTARGVSGAGRAAGSAAGSDGDGDVRGVDADARLAAAWQAAEALRQRQAEKCASCLRLCSTEEPCCAYSACQRDQPCVGVRCAALMDMSNVAWRALNQHIRLCAGSKRNGSVQRGEPAPAAGRRGSRTSGLSWRKPRSAAGSCLPPAGACNSFWVQQQRAFIVHACESCDVCVSLEEQGYDSLYMPRNCCLQTVTG